MTTNPYFDEAKWREAISTRHDWYRVLRPEFEAILSQYEGGDKSTRKIARDAVYGFVEHLLDKGEIVLGTSGKDWDKERKPVDTVVIHHSKVESGMTWQRLSAMHLLRLYAGAYLSPTTEKEIAGMPVWSNHFRGVGDSERMVFYAYHWLVRTDGTVERLLGDNEIGWHAGNWDINCRSVGICLDGDFEQEAPPKVMLDGARKIIREHYGNVPDKNIFPHYSANPHTTCPGEWFDLVVWK